MLLAVWPARLSPPLVSRPPEDLGLRRSVLHCDPFPSGWPRYALFACWAAQACAPGLALGQMASHPPTPTNRSAHWLRGSLAPESSRRAWEFPFSGKIIPLTTHTQTHTHTPTSWLDCVVSRSTWSAIPGLSSFVKTPPELFCIVGVKLLGQQNSTATYTVMGLGATTSRRGASCG